MGYSLLIVIFVVKFTPLHLSAINFENDFSQSPMIDSTAAISFFKHLKLT